MNDTEAIKAFLKDENYSYAAEDAVITLVNKPPARKPDCCYGR